jgi:hypothetical protein
MRVRAIRVLASVVILMGGMLLRPQPAAANCGTCDDTCLCCQCSQGGNYVCCQWISGAFNGCTNYGQVAGQCGVLPEEPGT